MRIRTNIFGLSVVILLLAGVVRSATESKVSGTVRDKSGHPLAHAYVEAIPVILQQSSAGTVGSIGNPWVAADNSGSFSLTLVPGRYRIRAKDEVDGYPDPSFWLGLDREARFPEIAVGATDIAGIEVVLGAQGGVLNGQVQGARTHGPIAGAKIRIEDARNSDSYVEVFTNGTGHFRYTVPSKPILISATAPGYERTEFSTGVEVTLSPGEHREIVLELEHE